MYKAAQCWQAKILHAKAPGELYYFCPVVKFFTIKELPHADAHSCCAVIASHRDCGWFEAEAGRSMTTVNGSNATLSKVKHA